MKISNHVQKLSLGIVVAVTVITVAFLQLTFHPQEPNLGLRELQVEYAKEDAPGVDHSQFRALNKNFKSPQEVTETCISCHTDSHNEVMASNHWNWDRVSYIEGKGINAIGKKNVLNNFCIGTSTNLEACASCHTGYGLENANTFNFDEPKNVDCLSCHDNSENYVKKSGDSGYPVKNIDLKEVAQSVGKPIMTNCGTCHFYGGGGNNVKHGDLEQALYNADREMDVHMAKDGIQMTCVDCHTAENHEIKGKLYSVSSQNINRAECQSCHTNTPHLNDMLNTHTAKVACQTCHIPTYAKENPTKMAWYWSTAGHLGDDGEPITMVDSVTGAQKYLSKKGTFVWGSDLEPEYVWFNGKAQHYMLGETIDTTDGPVQINRLLGTHADPNAKIIPVKIHRGDQIYDTENMVLIQPKLYSEHRGDSAFWKDFNWETAAAAGMKDIGLKYSGSHDFVSTEMYWPINHMVSPSNMSLQCADCHTQSDDGRLAELTGFYLPGRDSSSFFDGLGTWMLWLSFAGVLFHGGLRIVSHIRTSKNLEMKDYREFGDEEN
jgi:octaheme c-type cytochrome (tetrathionate reductase family)